MTNQIKLNDWDVIQSGYSDEQIYPEKSQAALTNDDLAKIGFFKYSALFTLGNTMRFDLGRYRYLKAICVGMGNEMVFLCADEDEPCSDLICIHNRDYDGPLTIERIKSFIDWFVGSKLDDKSRITSDLPSFPQAILDAERKRQPDYMGSINE